MKLDIQMGGSGKSDPVEFSEESLELLGLALLRTIFFVRYTT